MVSHWYLYYAIDHKMSEEERQAEDLDAHPNDPTAGFLTWIVKRLKEFKREQPTCFIGDSLIAQKKLADWLHQRSRNKLTEMSNELHQERIRTDLHRG
jgi:hypothetical protein